MGLGLETRNAGFENCLKRQKVKSDASSKEVVSKRHYSYFLYILPSRLRVVLIMQGRIQFFYGGKLTYIVQGTHLAMPKIIYAPNTSSLKTRSGATEGVMDYGVLSRLVYWIWAGLMGRQDTRKKTTSRVW